MMMISGPAIERRSGKRSGRRSVDSFDHFDDRFCCWGDGRGRRSDSLDARNSESRPEIGRRDPVPPGAGNPEVSDRE